MQHQGLKVAVYQGPVAWLRDHGMSAKSVADLFGISEEYARQLDYRARRVRTSAETLPASLLVTVADETPPSPDLRSFLGVRTEEDSVALTPRSIRQLSSLEDELEEYASRFWTKVPFASGAGTLKALLKRVGYPAGVRRIRVKARIHELLAETYLHAGLIHSALLEGLRSYHLYRVVFHEAPSRPSSLGALEKISRTSRLVSQMFLLKNEFTDAKVSLTLHREAQERLGLEPLAEYNRQLAVMAFRNDDEESDDYARRQLRNAMNKLEGVAQSGVSIGKHEIADIGMRLMYLLRPVNREGANQFLAEQMSAYPAFDIHLGLTVAAAAGCMLIDPTEAVQADAMYLLVQHQTCADGYFRTQTIFDLLRLTPRLPIGLRQSWVRFALYENTRKNL